MTHLLDIESNRQAAAAFVVVLVAAAAAPINRKVVANVEIDTNRSVVSIGLQLKSDEFSRPCSGFRSN